MTPILISIGIRIHLLDRYLDSVLVHERDPDPAFELKRVPDPVLELDRVPDPVLQ